MCKSRKTMSMVSSSFRRGILRSIPAVLMCSSGLFLSSCFDDSDSLAEQYKEWRIQNEQYVKEAEEQGGGNFYTRVTPSWAPNTFVLLHWHNDRSLTAGNLSPMDNSTTKITYELFDIEGNRLSDSFKNPDSVYTSKPSDNIIGMWTALTHMHVGDSVTMVIPASAGYGIQSTGTIKPYSTLIYNVKLKAITAYEIP